METKVIRVTLDTNILPVDDLIAQVSADQFEFGVVSVTERELETAPALSAPERIDRIVESMVWGEGVWGGGLWGGPSDSHCLETVLGIVSDGGFPRPNQRMELSDGQRRQLRDAIIFCAHVRTQREIFVTDDARGFVRSGRREKLQNAFDTRIHCCPR